MQLVYPQKMIDMARTLGVSLPPTTECDHRVCLMEMASELSPGADFGFWGPLKRVITAPLRGIARAAGGKKPAVNKGKAVAFGIKSSGVSMSAAMASADKLLGDPRVGNAQSVVRNTQALAALGDPAAKRGLLAIQAVATIRKEKGAKPGQKVIPTPGLPPRAVTIQRSAGQVRRMAAAAKPGVIQRIVTWFRNL